MTDTKFPENKRNFETRVTFIKDLFENKFERSDIMASCIKHKLGRSFENYIGNINKSLWNLRGEDPLKILQRIDK